MEIAVGLKEANNVKRTKNISCVVDADTSVFLGYARDLLCLNFKTFSPEQEKCIALCPWTRQGYANDSRSADWSRQVPDVHATSRPGG
jgi:hypothetical protein